jgi:hypothetical protein
VTQIAEVEVKRASMKERRPAALNAGIIKSRVPTRMALLKLMASICAGWKSFSLWMAMGLFLLWTMENLFFERAFVNTGRLFDIRARLC